MLLLRVVVVRIVGLWGWLRVLLVLSVRRLAGLALLHLRVVLGVLLVGKGVGGGDGGVFGVLFLLLVLGAVGVVLLMLIVALTVIGCLRSRAV